MNKIAAELLKKKKPENMEGFSITYSAESIMGRG